MCGPSGAQYQECLGAIPSDPTGGLSGKKIGTGAVLFLRLPLPNQRSQPVFRRRGAQCAPASLPLGEGAEHSEADEGNGPIIRAVRSNRRGGPMWPPTGTPGPVWDRPLRKDRRVSGYSVGAGVLTRPPIALTPWCLFGFFLGPQKETRRWGGETPSDKRNRSIVAPSSVWPSASHLPLSPLSLRDISP